VNSALVEEAVDGIWPSRALPGKLNGHLDVLVSVAWRQRHRRDGQRAEAVVLLVAVGFG